MGFSGGRHRQTRWHGLATARALDVAQSRAGLNLIRVLAIFLYFVFGLPTYAAGPLVAQASALPSYLTPPVGKVDVVTGQVRIAASGKSPRAAAVGMVVSEGDFILTDDASEALITMADQGFIAVRANSRVQILSYKADGGDDDNGIFRLAAGGMRSVTGWIGKFNRSAYRIQTPTATIGIRGTDHETRYLPTGSSDGPPGTYDKVFIGVTSIQTDSGEADISPDTAGFVGSDRDRPRILASVPAFFKPGPNEDLINAKHAQIQQIIEQRREERQRVVEQLRIATNQSLDELKTQSDRNRVASEQRSAQDEQQRIASDQRRAELRARQETLDTQRRLVADLRMQIVHLVAPFIASSKGAGRQLKEARDNAAEIQMEFKQMAAERRSLSDKNDAAIEARQSAALAHRQAADLKLKALQATLPDLERRYRSNEQMSRAIEDAMAKDPAGSPALSDQRHALDAAIDSTRQQRAIYQDGMNALFQDNVAFAEANIDAAIKQRLDTDQLIRSLDAREADLLRRQQSNDLVREGIQEGAVTDPEVKARVHALIEQVQVAMNAILEQRLANRRDFDTVHTENFSAYGQRQEASADEMRVIREKHAQFTGKLADLEAESAAMQQEIRTLYDQEQQRYLQELKAARAEQAAALSETPLPATDHDPEE